MFVVTPDTILNGAALETRFVPKRLLGRIALLPKGGVGWRFWARLLAEVQILRFLAPLLPLVAIMVIWPELALPISAAPVPMVIVIAFVELRVLAVRDRASLIDDTTADRAMDAFRFNANRLLTRIAAKRDLQHGEIMLVAEQSELARISPLTLVTVQQLEPPEILSLSAEERGWIEADLFDDTSTERDLHLIGLRDQEPITSVTLDCRSVSAHARMSALMATSA